MSSLSQPASSSNNHLYIRMAVCAIHTRHVLKREITEAVRAARADGLIPKGAKQSEAAAAVNQLVESIRAKRAIRTNARVTAFIQAPSSLAARLATYRKAKQGRVCEAVRAARKGLYRVASNAGKYAPGSGHTTRVQIGTPGATSGSGKVWGKQYSATASEHVYTVAADWLTTVKGRYLAVVDGMLTLSAEPVQGHGPELYRALWVEQGRGTALNQVRGYIARLEHDSNTYTYHACSARAALDGVQRKAKLKPARRKGTVDLDRLVRRHGDLPVYWDDREGLACESGTRNWCEAVDVDPKQTTVADVVRGYRLRPMPEALQVIRRVVRDRANRQPVAELDPRELSSLELPGRVVFDSEGGFTILPSDN